VHGRQAQVFVPPTIHYNPFSQNVIVEPCERTPKHSAQASAATCPRTPFLPSKSTFAPIRNLQATSRAMPLIRPPSVDSNLSDWTDCDMIEFETMGVCCYSCCVCYAQPLVHVHILCALLLMPKQSNAPFDSCSPCVALA
jgi:hypothetical protein